VSDPGDRSPVTSGAVAAFWELFRRRAADLERAASDDSAVHEALLEALHAIDPGLYLELAVDPGASELIVTADGERSLFGLAREVVAAAPRVQGWTVHALKPKLGLPVTVRWERVTLRTAEIVFEPLERKGSPELGLRILVPGLEERDIDDAHNAILRALDHGLGEEKLAEAVAYTEVRSLPADVAAGDFIPLSELEMFIQWRASKRA
jgi:hypothetical protein